MKDVRVYGYVKHPVIKKASFEGTRTGAIFMKKMMEFPFWKRSGLFLSRSSTLSFQTGGDVFQKKQHFRRGITLFQKKQHSLQKNQHYLLEKVANSLRKAALYFRNSSTLFKEKQHYLS